MRRAVLLAASALLFALTAVAGEVPLIADPVVAPATGTVFYQRQANKQTKLTIKVQNLKPASQLKPSPRKAYVVWLQEPNQPWRSIGVLQMNNKAGSLAASVPSGNMFVLITGENNSRGNKPTGPEIMQATILGP